MKKLFSLTLCALAAFSPLAPVQAMTGPDDMVIIYTLKALYPGYADMEEKYEQKKFRDLKLDKKTADLVRLKSAELDQHYCMDKNPLCTYRLISVRLLLENKSASVQRLILGNRLGETYVWGGESDICTTSLRGNAEVGFCEYQQPD